MAVPLSKRSFDQGYLDADNSSENSLQTMAVKLFEAHGSTVEGMKF